MFDAERLMLYYFCEQGVRRSGMAEELASADRLISSLVKVPLKDHQFQALRSLLADLVGGHCHGMTEFRDSGLLQELNAGRLQLAAGEFFAFAYRRGRVDKLLWKKRNAEQTLFRTGRLTLR